LSNSSNEPEEHRPKKVVRFILPREVCTDPETAAKIMHGEVQKALEALRRGDVPVDRPDSADGG
jgi:hypothetical protein